MWMLWNVIGKEFRVLVIGDRRKVDLKIFPMRYHELNLDVGKASKRDLKVALRIGPVALHVGQIFHRMAIFICFDCVHGFSLMGDVLLW